MELITGGNGTNHISSADAGILQAAIIGRGCFVSTLGEQLQAKVISSNKITIGTGAGFMNGRGFRVEVPETLTIESGEQAKDRNDIVAIHYSVDSYGSESMELVVIKGDSTSSGMAKDPEFPKKSILDNAQDTYFPLYRVRITGISTDTNPEQLFVAYDGMDTLIQSYNTIAGAISGYSSDISDLQSRMRSAETNLSSVNNKLAVNVPYTEINTQYWYIHYWAKNGVCTVTADSIKEGHTTISWDNVTINPGRPLPQVMRPRSELWFPCIVDNASGFGHTVMCIDASGSIRIMNRGGNQGTALQALFATGTWAVS